MKWILESKNSIISKVGCFFVFNEGINTEQEKGKLKGCILNFNCKTQNNCVKKGRKL